MYVLLQMIHFAPILIYSQARMIDSLIAGFVEHIKTKRNMGSSQQVEDTMVDGSATAHEGKY